MLTAVVSDLHLGTRTGIDLVRAPEPRRRLLEAVSAADRVVLLGDLLELREQPAGVVLDAARPLLDGIAEATAGKQLVLVPGNHDHALVAPALDEARIEDAAALPAEAMFSPQHSPIGRRLLAWLPQTEVVLAYPGIRLREDVYATHGHYLDMHLTVPRLEAVIASAVARLAGPERDGAPPRSPEAYEAALAPIYSLAYLLAQRSQVRAVTRGARLSRSVWQLADRQSSSGLAGAAVRGVAVPLAVGALNLMGLGPFGSDLSGAELRRSGLRAIGAVVEGLGVSAGHVIFGHTHRSGPHPGEEDEWRTPGGARLTNTGSWLYEPIFVDTAGPASPYWPGTVVLLRDEGPPELTGVLGDVDLRAASAQIG